MLDRTPSSSDIDPAAGIPELGYQINPQTYEWSVRAFRAVSKWLGVNFKLHHDKGQIEAGDIFLFNHFARVETFIPQYLIYTETGAFCRSVASRELFRKQDAFTRYIIELGVVPNNHPHLLFLLAADILKGRKIVIFPEGGMVKDRRVLDEHGEYSVYSRSAMKRRKHHSGAAVLAVLLDAFKAAVLKDYERGRHERLDRWQEALGLSQLEALVAAARKPTTIVPANITFYPLHIDENVLQKYVERFGGNLSKRGAEELLIESNILLRNTDMDIRLGRPLRPSGNRGWWQRLMEAYLARRADRLEDFFTLDPDVRRWDRRLLSRVMHRAVARVRDRYMQRIYAAVTINLSHVASHLILQLAATGLREVSAARFRTMLYLAVKRVQTVNGVHLHRALKNPGSYGGVIDGGCQGLEEFLRAASEVGLLHIGEGNIRFLDKLLAECDFDVIRRENPVVVYANESAPVKRVLEIIAQVIAEVDSVSEEDLARLRFDDELLSYHHDLKVFRKPKHEAINAQETATASGEPYLLVPDQRQPLGIVMVHGFLASPAELRGLAEHLAGQGYPVIGVRLKGHGTSPWDLRERKWQDWLTSVRNGHEIMRAFVPRICLIGFSTGGALSLIFAAEQPAALAGAVVAAVPIKFRNTKLIFAPLVHTANRLLKWVSSEEGPFPFRANQSEHPHINYRNMPIRGLYELTRVVDALDEASPAVRCPVTLLHATEDTVVDPKSAQLVYKKLGSAAKTLHMIQSDRHGVINENIGETWRVIDEVLTSLASERGVVDATGDATRE
ncbi:MAG: alpha/beta fold hydrolase [Chromatiales bacterium]